MQSRDVILGFVLSLALIFGWGAGARAEEEAVRLAAPVALTDTGLMKYILPRFTLKTQVRVKIVAEGDRADVALGPGAGRALFIGPAQIWRMEVRRADHAGVQRFADWLTSEIGSRTITGFTREGVQPFTLAPQDEVAVVETEYDGDAVAGLDLSRTKCGRCHAVTDEGRIKSIGSTPSFFVLRSLKDWEYRFKAFYMLNPHPSFTQITDVTRPFAEERPPPIVPIEITLEDLGAILAYVSALEPADLGKPLEHQ